MMIDLSEPLLSIPERKRIVFLGDSITENGAYIRYLDAYFLKYMPDRRLELINLGVGSETAAGTHEASHPFPRPCVHERLERALAETEPEWVFLCYGMNDGIYHPFSEERFELYREGMMRAAKQVEEAGARVILMTPPAYDVKSINGEAKPEGMAEYAFETPYEDYNGVLGTYASWIKEFGAKQGYTVVDLREPLMEFIRMRREADPAYKYNDGVHPEDDGHWVIARAILKDVFRIALDRTPDWARSMEGSFIRAVSRRRDVLNAAWREHVGHSSPYKFEALPLEEALNVADAMLAEIARAAEEEGGAVEMTRGNWNGYVRNDFYFRGRECILVEPKHPAPGRPWIWRCEFFGAFADADLALVEQGWHLAYIRLSDLYGCGYAAGEMESFRAMLAAEYDLSAKPVLLGFSRGGLYALRYAAMFPERTAALYLDAPVVDIRSWPGGLGKGLGSAAEWRDCLAVYGLTGAEERAGGVTDGLLASLASAAKSGIDILLVSGDADRDVPFEENGALLERSYRAQGGKVATILKPGGDHHPHGLPDAGPIVDFIRGRAEY